MKAVIGRPAKQNEAESLGGIIRAARQQAGLTQEGLAEASGLPRYWLGRWERNRAVPAEAERQTLARFLGVGINHPPTGV